MIQDFEKLFWNSFAGVSNQTYPPYNIIRRGTDFIIEVAVSGFVQEELSVDYDGRTIEIVGTKVEEENDATVEYIHRSLAKRNFKQTIAVRGQFDIGEVYLTNGILTIIMKDKTERVRPRIQIKSDIPRLTSK